MRGFSGQTVARNVADMASEFDFWAFAREGGERESSIAVTGLHRLHDALASQDGVLTVQIKGQLVDGRSSLRIGIVGKLQMVCQRCLEPMDWLADINTVIVLSKTGVEFSPIANEAELSVDDLDDVVVIDAETTLERVIEDEVLLSLPISATHDRCTSAVGWQDAGALSPFAVLRDGIKNQSKE